MGMGKALRYRVLVVHHVGGMGVVVVGVVVIGGWTCWRRKLVMSVYRQVCVGTGWRRHYCHCAVVPFRQARLRLVTRAAAALVYRLLRV